MGCYAGATCAAAVQLGLWAGVCVDGVESAGG